LCQHYTQWTHIFSPGQYRHIPSWV
jgi:hypothetical protein